MEKLLSIGEFSARCGLSPKMLRTYAAAGLLAPAAVDPGSGYRYYLQAQVDEARTIGLLRQAAVPLGEIASFLQSPTDAQIAEWQRRLDVELDARRQALEAARERLAIEELPATTPKSLDPDHERNRSMINTMTAATATDIGLVREVNQDAVLAEDRLFAVADGMGGKGEVASVLALATLQEAFAGDLSADGLVRSLKHANRVVWEQEGSSADSAGTGTTLTALAVLPDEGGRVVAANVGDSRLYRLRGGLFEQLTEDHSIVGELVRTGELTEEQARSHPHRRLLTRALGVGPVVEPDLVEVDCQSGDRLLICTDGLFNDVPEPEIASVLAPTAPGTPGNPGEATDPVQAAGDLVRLAVALGGNDNVTVIVVDVA